MPCAWASGLAAKVTANVVPSAAAFLFLAPLVTFQRDRNTGGSVVGMERHGATEYAGVRKLLTVPELCEILRIGRTTAYRLVNNGSMRAVVVGDRLRFRPEDVNAYLERNREPAL